MCIYIVDYWNVLNVSRIFFRRGITVIYCFIQSVQRMEQNFYVWIEGTYILIFRVFNCHGLHEFILWQFFEILLLFSLLILAEKHVKRFYNDKYDISSLCEPLTLLFKFRVWIRIYAKLVLSVILDCAFNRPWVHYFLLKFSEKVDLSLFRKLDRMLNFMNKYYITKWFKLLSSL